MKIKVLLLYPEIPITYWSFKYGIAFVGKKGYFPPLGLLTIAAMLPDDYEVKLIDMNISKLNEDDILDSDIVFISSMIIQKKSFDEAVRMCNRLGKPIVAGGPYATSTYKKIEGIDHFVLNEAETTLPAFLSDFRCGKAKRIYTDATKPDITSTPVPRFDLTNMNQYAAICLQFSRGCPFNCEFCDITEMFGRKTRTKSKEQFIKEMNCAYNTGFRGCLFIVDDNFIGNKKNVKMLLPAIIKWQRERRYPFSLITQTSIDLAQDEELMNMMIDAGFDSVFLGIETPVKESLKLTKKNQNLKSDMLESIITIQKKGMEVMGGFIIGFDNDPDNIFDLQIDFIQKAGIPSAMTGILMALPNTQLYRRLKSEDRIIEDSSGNNTHHMQINFQPKMDMESLLIGYKYLISEIYKPEKYFERCLTLIKRLPVSKFSYIGSWRYVRALLLSMIRQSFSNYGYHYLKFITKGMLTNPRHFTTIIRLAIFGHHYFTITRELLTADSFKNHLDELTQSLRDRMAGMSVSNFDDALKKIQSFRNILVAQVQNEYFSIHKDFRMLVEDSLKYFHKITEEVISEWENTWCASDL
ncbi:MAG: radical SAM protein [Spirochaetota bacterium]|nr:radical SAM protein [Spirochaetota bacterium]